jgi:predicted dehydrogenase
MNHEPLPSRRDFVKQSSLAAAGVTLAGGLSLARSAHAAGADQIKVALIGCGGRGTGAARDCLSVHDNLKLVAVADAFADRADRSLTMLREAFPGGGQIDVPKDRVFIGFDAYAHAIDAGVDLVLLTTPPGFRPIHYQAAVAAGKHVFMEKPCCIDAPGFNKLMAANKLADQKGLKVGVGLQRHHDPGYLKGVKQLQDGALGPLNFFRVYWNSDTPWIHPRRPQQTEMEYQMRNWYFFVWLSGDHILEQHVHNIDVANWIKGDHPVEANGMGGRQVRKGKDVGHIFDHHFVEFTYADGTKLFSQCRQQPGCCSAVGEYAHGAKGSRAVTLAAPRHGETPYFQEHADLVRAIRDNRKYNEGWYGATSSMTGVLGRMATYSGQVVRWDEAVAKGPDEMPEKFAWDALPKILPDKDGLYEHAVPVPGVYKAY